MPGLLRQPGRDGRGPTPEAAAQLSQQKGELRQHEAHSHFLHVLRDPWFVGNEKLQLVTVETRPNRTKVPGIKNVGFNQTWQGFMTKLELMSQWLDEQKDDEALVIFVDGEDTLFGGCSQEQFMRDYQDIVNRSGGAEVVTGAERGCYEIPRPWYCEGVPKVPEWAVRDWTRAAGGREIGGSHLDRDGQMRFVNSGFIMGPVGKLRQVFQTSLEDMQNWRHEGRLRGDQYYVARYILGHGESAVPDYGSSLVTCGYSLDPLKLFKLLPGGGLYNEVTEKQQCFFHANGPSFKESLGIIRWQQGGEIPREVG